MKIRTVNQHVYIRPLEEKSAWESSQKKFAERGEVLVDYIEFKNGLPSVILRKGDIIDFKSWVAYCIAVPGGEDRWYVPYEAVIAIVEDEEILNKPISE